MPPQLEGVPQYPGQNVCVVADRRSRLFAASSGSEGQKVLSYCRKSRLRLPAIRLPKNSWQLTWEQS